ncbi:hypothetical protein [uncultured Tateyamaria sp.]|uniref:hypothetical protein n=1 Tax=uncultured Tateyamaria sp. TaxID=455651 RepID=UPI002614AC0E|nr:hypothetical protein [uncultured Tateyamaria sp.]
MKKSLFTALLPLAAAFSQPTMAQEFGVEMPVNPTPDTVFPTSETEINSWIFGTYDNAKIYEHGWSVWAGLTTPTDVTALGIENALIYQTWLAPLAIYDLTIGNEAAPILGLRQPLQHAKGGKGADLSSDATANDAGIKVDYSVAEVVAYSPTSAQHALSNKLLLTQTLQTYLEQGYSDIPAFPPSTVNIKPVYKLISASDLTEVGGRNLYAMPAWPGTPDTSNWTSDQLAKGYPNTLWGQCTYIDMALDASTTATGVDPGCDSPDDSNIFSVSDFISIPVTDADIAYFKADFEQAGDTAAVDKIAVGDTLILVGMHVGTRETQRWTWQTFWWAADPDAPNSPSSVDHAAARPDSLTAQAAHYAMATAYSMLIPAQPIDNGNNVGQLLPAYNPHLEATFGTGTFTGGTGPVVTPDGTVTTNLGVQSNCMTCHGLAGVGNPNSAYASNMYVARNAPGFDGGLKVDFSWSIADEAKPAPVAFAD